jgi:multidrug efflux pump subunit AcrB
VYRPVRYLDSALQRVGLAALIGVVLLALVIGVLSRSWRVAVTALAAVATSVTAALWVLYLRGDTLTSMTLIGVATAMVFVVDDAFGDAVVLRSRLRARRDAGQDATLALVAEVTKARRGPLACATLVALLALAPLFLLTGPVGALVRPAVLTTVLVVAVSLVVGLIVTPVLSLMLLGGRRAAGASPEEPVAPTRVRRAFDRLSGWSVGRPLAAGVVLAVLALLALPGLGLLEPGNRLPTAQDRSLVVRLEAASGTALSEMNRITSSAAAELSRLRGVRTAGTHVGRAVASDVVSDVNTSEIWLTVADSADYGGTLDRIRAAVGQYPGLRSEVQTYEADQLATAGATTGDKLVVRVYGQNLDTLRTSADDVRQTIQTVTGVISPQVQAQVTVPTVEIEVDLAAARAVGLRPGDIRRDASTLISGLTVGSLYQQQAIFDVVLWGGPATRSSVPSLQSLLLDTPSGQKVPLGSVAQVRVAPSPAVITHDAVSRSLDVTADIRGRSAADVTRDVTDQLQRMNFPYEYRAEVVGDAVSRASGQQWILLAIGTVVVLGYLLLQAATGSWRGAAVLLVIVPFAAVGALLGAQVTGRVLDAGVLAALFGVMALALRQALLLVRRAQTLTAESGGVEAMRRAVRENAPVVIAVALALGALVLPAAVMGGGAGLEVLHPFAVALLIGLVSALAVVLGVVPSLYPALAGLRPLPAPPDADADADAASRHAEPPEPPRARDHPPSGQSPTEREDER